MKLYKLTASQLTNLLQILGALTADYLANPTGPMNSKLVPFVRTRLQWKDLPDLDSAIRISIRGGDKVSALYNLGVQLKTALPIFSNNRDYSTPEIQMLKAIRSYLCTDSEVALKYMKKNASVFGNPALAKLFMPDVPASDNVALRKSVKGLVGRDGTFLTTDEARMLKETNSQAYEKYVQLRKTHTESYKGNLAALVRDSGKKTISYTEAYKKLSAQGFASAMVPGFTGLIDDQGRWYANNGEIIGGVPNTMTYDKVVMNPEGADGKSWVFKAEKKDGTYAHFYTANFRRQQSVAKYRNVALLIKKIPAIRKNWLVHIKNFDPSSKTSVCAVILEVLFSYAARIGSEPGRGAGTLLVKNMSITQMGVNLAYIGKDSIPTKHIIKRATSREHAQLVDALVSLGDGKTGSFPLYTTERDGRYFKVLPADVNKAFRQFGAPAELSVHKLRTCRGTSLFQILMAKDANKRPPTTEKEAMARYKDMTEQIGKLLNHKRGVGGANEKVTGATAATSYIDADMQIALWENWGFRPPAILEKLMRFDL